MAFPHEAYGSAAGGSGLLEDSPVPWWTGPHFYGRGAHDAIRRCGHHPREPSRTPSGKKL